MGGSASRSAYSQGPMRGYSSAILLAAEVSKIYFISRGSIRGVDQDIRPAAFKRSPML